MSTTPTTTLSTHVLDAERGRPSAGMRVTVLLTDGTSIEASTDADGRHRFAAELPSGVHTLTFSTGDWFSEQGRATFYPSIAVTFEAVDGEHHHVALLLSPFAYTTYRGS